MKKKDLLPPGFRDDLSPVTENEHFFTNKIISIFNSNGYQIIKPPMIEFLSDDEDDKNFFVIINENGEQTLKVRNDITMQVARIASSRLANEKRPLRLCYYGEVIRQEGNILRPERQFLQVGAECIGEKNYLADAEILILAFESLKSVGIKNISIDFSNPIFINYIKNSDLKHQSKKNEFLKYLQRKDTDKALSYIKNLKKIDYIKTLIDSAGNISENINILNKLKKNRELSKEITILIKIKKILKNRFEEIEFNVDFTENRYQTYYTGLNFTIYAKDVRGEIAKGGRYKTGSEKGESATGFACYMDSIVRASSSILKQKRIMVPFDISEKKINLLVKRKFIIERCFYSKGKLLKIAKQKKCSHIFINNKIKMINYD